MRSLRDEREEAAARLHSNQKAWAAALEDYEVTVAGIRARCPHSRVKYDHWEYGDDWTCRDCGQSESEPFGTVV